MRYCVAALLVITSMTGHASAPRDPPEQKGRIGNWYYIAGSDGLFHVPRFVAAVHDVQARTSLVFTCQVRPGVKPTKTSKPMMGVKLSPAIGARGTTTLVRMRLDEASPFQTKWQTSAPGESTLDDKAQADPLQLLFRIAGNKHRLLTMEAPTSRVQFELEGARAVLLKMLDRCVKPATGRDAKRRKRRGK